MTWTGPPRPIAFEPAKHRVDRDGFDAIAEALLVRVVVEGDVGAGDARAEPLQRPEVQRRRLVAVQAAATPAPASRVVRRRVLRPAPAFRSPTGSTAGSGLRPRVRDHAVGGRVEPRDQARCRAAPRSRCACASGASTTIAASYCAQVVEEELAQALAVERGARRAALVELVHDAPDRAVAVALAVGESEVRVAQAVLAQVLAGAGEHHDAGAALRPAARRCARPAASPAPTASRARRLAARSCDRRGRRSAARDQRAASARRRIAARAHRVIRLVVEQRRADLVRHEGDRLARGREHPAGAERRARRRPCRPRSRRRPGRVRPGERSPARRRTRARAPRRCRCWSLRRRRR